MLFSSSPKLDREIIAEMGCPSPLVKCKVTISRLSI